MTIKELNSAKAITKEIHKLIRERDKRFGIATNTVSALSAEGHGTAISDKVGDSGSELGDLSVMIDSQIQKLRDTEEKIFQYIITVDDSLLRQAMFLKFIGEYDKRTKLCRFYSWKEISIELGTSEYSIKKAFYRHMVK